MSIVDSPTVGSHIRALTDGQTVDFIPSLRVVMQTADHFGQGLAQGVGRLPTEIPASPMDTDRVVLIGKVDHPRLDKRSVSFVAGQLVLDPRAGFRGDLRNPNRRPLLAMNHLA
jgi:hypothetical protein